MSEAGEREIWKGMRPSAGVAMRGLDRRLQVSRLLTRVCPDQDGLRLVCGEHVEERVSGEPLMNLFSTPHAGVGARVGTRLLH